MFLGSPAAFVGALRVSNLVPSLAELSGALAHGSSLFEPLGRAALAGAGYTAGSSALRTLFSPTKPAAARRVVERYVTSFPGYRPLRRMPYRRRTFKRRYAPKRRYTTYRKSRAYRPKPYRRNLARRSRPTTYRRRYLRN